ncbi:MAG: phosphate acetyltransferase [Gammaproteobacteria bacterium]|nr:phosphate acetyltransferase [Gammaproteobacteria bacterium]
MNLIEQLVERAKSRRRSVILPEGEDPRIMHAARRLHDEGIARPVLVGERAKLEAAAASAGASLEPLEIVSPSTSEALGTYASLYVQGRPKATERVAKRLLSRPLFYAAMAVKAGDADALVAGASQPTARVIEAGLMSVGLAQGISTPSSFFIMAPQGDGTPLLFADCAVNVEPDAEELADIAIASAESAERLLGVTAKVAMLSFSTHGSARHERIDKVRRAAEIARARAPELAVDGDLQADAAIVPRVAELKTRRPSDVAGRANVLVFPDLDSGNIAYKLSEHLGGMRAIGPFLQGFSRPLCDLSRGATVDDVVAAAAITAMMS